MISVLLAACASAPQRTLDEVLHRWDALAKDEVLTQAEVDEALDIRLGPSDPPWTHTADAAPPVASVRASWGPERVVKLRLRLTLTPGTCLSVADARTRYGHLFLEPESPHGPALGHPVWVVQRDRTQQLLFEEAPGCISTMEIVQRGPLSR